jgi:hypothetical protein
MKTSDAPPQMMKGEKMKMASNRPGIDLKKLNRPSQEELEQQKFALEYQNL